MNEPTAVAAAISAATKAVLLAVVAIEVLPWSDTQISAITLAVAQVIDLCVLFGLIRPSVTPLAAPKDSDGTPLIRKR